ncbi:MAG TPA: stage II sporulation protein D [Cerasibacillus sp.]|uniref:stage II sporulation protein D n=1 Tax=Cerasibacillus sp. TaxID=2498711 RepID=UPI002F3E3120
MKQWSPKKSKKIRSLRPKPNRLFTFMPVLAFLCIIAIVLIIPTIIVIPSQSKEQVTPAKEDIEIKPIKNSEADAITVSVMRKQTKDIENIPLETYVSHVVASEMPAEFELEALKAQSLTARTYVVNQMLHNQSEADVTDTTSDQVFQDETELRERWGDTYHEKMSKINEAVQATRGKILTYNETPIFPAYFSTSNGYTENSEDYWDNKLPYLRSVKSPWDKDSPKFLDQKTISIQEVSRLLDIPLQLGTPLPITVTRTKSQRVKNLKIGEKTLTGRDVRERLDLRSNDFTVTQKGDYLIFKTKGFGHGVGMSQYGANGMAKEGKTYDEIVKYYYKDVEISSIDESAPALLTKK